MSTPERQNPPGLSAAAPRRWVPVRRGTSPWTIVLLLLMALADAYGFWTVLYSIIGSDKIFLFVIVVALSLGCVAGAHEIGRLARRRREGFDASIAWILFLSVVWTAVGLAVGYTRASQHSLAGGVTVGTGPLAIAPPVAPTGNKDLTIALVLGGLYLLTGALAAGDAYRNGDPRSAAARDALARQEKLIRERARKLAEVNRMESLVQQRVDERRRDDDAAAAKHEESRAVGVELSRYADLVHAEALEGGPAATEAVTKPR